MTPRPAQWWSRRFLKALEKLGVGPFNDALAPEEFGFAAGRVWARYSDGAEARLELEPFSEAEWEESLRRLAHADLASVALLSVGRLPPNIDQLFRTSGRRLLPYDHREVAKRCTCSAYRSRRDRNCPHLGGLSELLGCALDRDPSLLFLLRGREPEALKRALHERWSSAPGPPSAERSEESIGEARAQPPPALSQDEFWNLAAPLPTLPQTLGRSELTLERLGTPDPRIDEAAWKAALLELYLAAAHPVEEDASPED